MSFAPGWDRRDPRTLRFVDAQLERSFQEATLEPFRHRIRLAMLLVVPVWVVVALLGPPVVGVADPGPVYAICGAMVVVLVLGALLTWLVRSRRGLEVVGLTANAVAGIAVVALTVVTTTFDRFAAVGVLFSTVVALNVFRLAFPFAVVLLVTVLAAFTVFAVAHGNAVLFQFFILAAALVLGSVGTYLVESGERQLFSQERQISALHRQVEGLFLQYLSPSVASSLLAVPERAELGGEMVEVTVLFADLQDFTPFSERRSPREVVSMLNAAFGFALPIVFEEGGTVVQFAGDGVMAIFNAPVRQPDHALRAARAALRIQAVPDAGDRPRFRIGLSTGPAVVGNVGSAELRSFTATGDTTNLAARLQTVAPVGSVVVGEPTYRLIEPMAVVRELGTPPLKGRSEATVVYELLSLRETDASVENPAS